MIFFRNLVSYVPIYSVIQVRLVSSPDIKIARGMYNCIMYMYITYFVKQIYSFINKTYKFRNKSEKIKVSRLQ